MAHIVGVPKREPCKKCNLPVFLAERINVGKHIYHRTCLKCARCKSQLSLGSFYETEIDGEFCCETCPDEETTKIDDSDKYSSTLRSSKDGAINENINPNRNTSGIRNSIADRLAFFERNNRNDDPLLQKSVSDEEKTKSLKKIAAKYKSNPALSEFMNKTLAEATNTVSDDENDDEEQSMGDYSKCDSTIESSENENEIDQPPPLPKDGPPIENLHDNKVLSVSKESQEIVKNNNEIEQNKIKENAPEYISNSKVFLTSPILSSPTPNPNHQNNNNNLNINNNHELNISSNITKDISNIHKNIVQTGTSDDTKELTCNQLNVNISNPQVEFRDKNELNKPLNFDEKNTKIDPTEQRLSVVRSRLKQFEENLKSDDDCIIGVSQSSRKSSSTSISSSSKLKFNELENSKLDIKSVSDKNNVKEQDNNENMTLAGNEVPKNEETIIECELTKETIEKIEFKNKNIEEKMEVDVDDKENVKEILQENNTYISEETEKLDDIKQDLKESIVHNIDEINDVPMQDEINITEQIKLSEDDKQLAVINVNNSNESNTSDSISHQTSEQIIVEENVTESVQQKSIEKHENVPVEVKQLQEEIHIDDAYSQNTPTVKISAVDEKSNEINRMTIINQDKKSVESSENKYSSSPEHKPSNEIKSPTKSIKNEDIEIDYPEELNPFASDDDSEQKENVEIRSKTNKEKDRRKSLNPFESSDDENHEEKFDENSKQHLKQKPPRPPPPRISKNPFGSDTEDDEEHDAGGSLVSTGSGRRRPVPTPRSQLTPTNRNTITPEPTPRSTRQIYSAGANGSARKLSNSNEYYGSSASLNSSVTSPSREFHRYHETRSSNNSLGSSTGGSATNTIRSRKKKAPAPPPPTVSNDSTGITSPAKVVAKELFPPNNSTHDVESKKSTPTSSTSTTPQMSRKKRPAPKPPTGLNVTPKKNESFKSNENVPELTGINSPKTDESNLSSMKETELSEANAEGLHKVEIEKLSDEEKVARLDDKRQQFFLAATSTSSKVSEFNKEEESSLNVDSTAVTNDEKIVTDTEKTGGVECHSQKNISDKKTTEIDTLVLETISTKQSIPDTQETVSSKLSDEISIIDPVVANIDIQHDRHIEKIKDNKESKNRNRQSQNYNDIDLHNDPLLNKSFQGKWKRRKGPAPSLPVPPRKILQMLPLQEIRHELDIIEVQQQGLEKQGVILETMIRERCEGKNGELLSNFDEQANSKEVEDLILQLFELVNEKNELFRRQAELMYLRRQHRLEQEQADLEYEIRVLMAQPERNKTDSDKAREEALIARLVEVVQLRNEVIECLEMDRIREAEEDLSIKQRLEIHTAKREAEQSKPSHSQKLSKKEKKKQKEAKKLGKSKKIDADKDADESEISIEVQKKKKKRKFIFSALTSSKSE